MKFIPQSITRSMGRQALSVKKHSPTLLFGVGVVGMVGTVVLASRATLQLEGVLDDIRKDQADLEMVASKKDLPNWSEEDTRHAAIGIMLKGGIQIVKLYGPAAIVGALSITALGGSHHILSKRNVALTAAYAAVERAFNEYRSRVVEEYGVAKDKQLRYGSQTREYIVETDTGPQAEERTRVDPMIGETMYAQWFGPSNKNWRESRDANLYFLQLQERFANDHLRARGHLFLNEVYEWLGMEHTKAGAVVGWFYDGPQDRVDFGIFDGIDGQVDDFMTGASSDILIDFNVDGIIYGRIGESK